MISMSFHIFSVAWSSPLATFLFLDLYQSKPVRRVAGPVPRA